jgi:drug/metabolite transporter (DMT)-like permease
MHRQAYLPLLIGVLVPVFGTVLSIIILGEDFHIYHAVAMAMVMGGIWLAETSGRKAANA